MSWIPPCAQHCSTSSSTPLASPASTSTARSSSLPPTPSAPSNAPASWALAQKASGPWRRPIAGESELHNLSGTDLSLDNPDATHHFLRERYGTASREALDALKELVADGA